MLTFLADEAETHLPMHKRTKVYVCDNGKRVATLACDLGDQSQDRSHSTQIWRAKLHHKQFDPFKYNHEKSEEEPYVDADEEGRMALHNPSLLSIADARQWVRDHYRGGN